MIKLFEQFVNEGLSSKIKELKTYLTTHYKTKEKELKSINTSLSGVKVHDTKQGIINNFFNLLRGYYNGKKIDYSLPSYYHYEYDSTVENCLLVHFSNNAQIIYKTQKFLYGPDKPENLALAHKSVENRKLKVNQWYNFAFFLNDLIKYSLGYFLKIKFLKVDTNGDASISLLGDYLKIKNKSMYGSEAVVFFVPAAIRIYAPMDKQYQAIFYSKEAKNINLIQNDGEKWIIKDKHQKETIFKNDNILDLLKDYEKNYNKYKKELK